jgi:ABC-type nickel/cobalt efflux system permease component RcnA
MRRRPVLSLKSACLIALSGLFLLVAASAQAETKPPSAFAPQGQAGQAAPPPPAFAPPGGSAAATSSGLFGWVLKTQQSLQRDLAAGVKNLKGENAFAGAVMLAALSFLYGVVHAVGPGHGKAIISSYVVANEETVRRGIVISFLAAAMQALTAIALVGILAIALNSSGLEITAWSNQLESVSYALIALVGLWLLVTQLLRLYRRWRGEAAAHDHHHHHHDHGHHHRHAHAHAEGEACGHIVDAKELAGPFSWRKVLAVVLSVGVRPCTGAILVLVFALAQGLFWAGVAATFAMALGTAITVAVLASLALGSRELALKLGGRSGAWANGVWTACAIGGSALIFLMGAVLFAASLGPARPF